MRLSIILCAVVAVGGMFASRMLAQSIADSTRSVSITVHRLTESKSPYPQGAGVAFNQTVQDSYSDGTGTSFGINETALSQQTSSIAYTNSSGQTLDVNVGGTVSFNMVGFDYVETDNSCLLTFTLNSPAVFSITESSNLEQSPLGGDGENQFAGGNLSPGTSPLVLEPNLIPYISTLAQESGGAGTPNPITGKPDLTYSATVAPGTYTYWVFAGGHGTDHEGGTLTFTSDFQITPTPEPVALPLLGMSAVAMLPRRRSTRC